MGADAPKVLQEFSAMLAGLGSLVTYFRELGAMWDATGSDTATGRRQVQGQVKQSAMEAITAFSAQARMD